MFKKTKVCSGVLVALGGALLVSALPALAQSGDRVEITGSRIKSINAEGTSPVAVLGAADIKIDGVRNVESLLNNLPQVFADQGGNVVNGASGTAAVNLRGLGSDRTLVLMNGRRLPMGSANSVSPDLNQIPAALIKRIEVLTGGASAVYGSDAVAGVVNFIMNDKFEGVQLELNHSFFNHKQQNPAGIADIVAARAATNPAQFQVPGDKSADGKETNFSMLLGGNFAGDKGNATIFFNYKKADALLQSERDFSGCSLAASSAGFSCGGSGTNATGRIGVGAPSFGTLWTNADTNGTARRFVNATDQYNFGPVNYFQRPSERYGFNAFANYQVNDSAKVYTELSFHDDLTVAQIAPGGAFIDVYSTTFDNPLLSASWKSALGLTAPGQSVEFTMGRRNVEGGGRQSEYRNTSYRSLIGVKGDVGKWSYDAYAIASKVIYSQTENNYFLAPRIVRAMDVVGVNGVATCRSVVDGSDPACVPYNIWKLGGVTPASLAYLQTPGFRKGSTTLDMQGVTLSTDLSDYGIKLPGSKSGVGVVFGFENRKEALSLSTDAATTAGELSGSGGPTIGLNGSFRVQDYFTEVRVPILEGMPLAEQLTLNGSYRKSSYNTGVDTNTYGVGMDWAPVKLFKLRGSYQSAARAPNLIELYTAQGANLFDMNTDPCSTGSKFTAAECARTGLSAALYNTNLDSPAGQYNRLTGGNPALKAESSKSVTLGIVVQPVKDMSFSIDYFDIKVTDTISAVSASTTLDQCLRTGDAKFCSLVTRDRAGTLWLLPQSQIVETNQNIGATSTKGYDFGFNYALGLGGMGNLGINATGTLLKALVTEEVPGLGSYDCVGLYGLDKCGSPNPEWRHKIRGTWATPWNVDVALTWRYMSKVVIQESSDQSLLNTNPFQPVNKTLAAQNYIDLAGSWAATKGLTIGFGINNLFDKDPPVVVVGTGQGNGNTFPGVYDALGRKVFLNGTFKF